jgi:hypothetical protein
MKSPVTPRRSISASCEILLIKFWRPFIGDGNFIGMEMAFLIRMET